MRKFLLVLSTVVLLTGCNNASANPLTGKWEKTEGSVFCRESFTFQKENTFQFKNSNKTSGSTVTGTYKHIEDNDYQFDYGGGYDMFTIKLNKNGGTMTVQMADSDNICTYDKVEE
jgi:hypothetical protein